MKVRTKISTPQFKDGVVHHYHTQYGTFDTETLKFTATRNALGFWDNGDHDVQFTFMKDYYEAVQRAKGQKVKPLTRGERIAWIVLLAILCAVIAIGFLTSCATPKVVAVKPYTIVDKTYIYTDRNRNAEYVFTDAAGRHFMFYDDASLHEIGDVIDDPDPLARLTK
jgi:hypothetical protein